MTDIDAAGERCPDCEGALRSSGTETICEECGLVLREDAIELAPEWRSSDDGDGAAPHRTGAPLTRTRHDRGLSTEIGYGTGSDVSGSRQRQLVRMRREHNRARVSSKADRNRVYSFTEIRRMTAALSLPSSICEQACALFESAQSEGLLGGRSLEGFAAASVYATCRVQSISRTTDEVVAVARADEAELKAAYTALNRELGLPTGPIDPSEYLPRYASKLGLEADVESRAHEYAAWLVESGRLGGKNPSGVAAACLYKAAYDLGVDVTQIEAADLANVSRMTIRSTVNALKHAE